MKMPQATIGFLVLSALPALAQGAEERPAAVQAGTFVNERRSDQWLASELRAKNVYDRSDTKIGAINDLLIDRDGRIAAVIIGVGGFLGIGEKNVGIPFSEIKISLREGAEWLVLERSREDLKAAPTFGPASGPPAHGTGASDRSYGTLNAPAKADEKR